MAEHKGATDKIHKIELPSAIEQVAWTRQTAAAGGEVGLLLFTRYVGNGADVEVALSDDAGKKVGTFKSKMAGNRYWLTVKTPKDARALVADVKLPKHGLSIRSPALLLTPPVEITDAKWDKEKVKRGDILKLSASVRDAPDGTNAQITIFEHDEQAAHGLITTLQAVVNGGKVETEWEFQYAQDTARIPTVEEAVNGYMQPRFFFRVSAAGASVDSPSIPFHDWIDITLEDEDGSPVPDTEYAVKFADGSERRGTLNGDGKAREEDIPPGPYFVSFPDAAGHLNIDASEIGET